MERFRILYAGPSGAGRRTSLKWLSRRDTVDGHGPPHRLDGQEVQLSSGEVIVLDAVVPYFGSFWFESFDECTTCKVDWIRDVARGVLEFLPTIDGVVFVAASWRHRELANVDTLQRMLRELAIAGLDVKRLPFVFQQNQRDFADSTSFHEMAGSLTTPRCAQVESIADVGYGVVAALDSLVKLIREGVSGAARPPPKLIGASAKDMPESPLGLFKNTMTVVTQDGRVKAALRSRTEDSVVVLGDSALALAWPKVPVKIPPLAPGELAVELVDRLVAVQEADRWRVIRSSVVAGRVRLRDAKAVTHELLAPSEWRSPTLVMVGTSEGIQSVDQFGIAGEAYSRIRQRGAGVLSRRGSKFELAERGEIVVLEVGTNNEAHLWLGRDEAGRVVEVAFCGDEGAAVARQMGGRADTSA